MVIQVTDNQLSIITTKSARNLVSILDNTKVDVLYMVEGAIGAAISYQVRRTEVSFPFPFFVC